MLLLMRRVGETIRINDTVTIQIVKINNEGVTFMVEGLNNDVKNDPSTVKDQQKKDDKEKSQV
jgi:hypothetical protein